MFTFQDIKTFIDCAPDMSFEEIAQDMGVSKQRVQQIYASALKKIKANLTEEQKEEIQELLLEEDTAYETMLEEWALQQDRGLHGFWDDKEK